MHARSDVIFKEYKNLNYSYYTKYCVKCHMIFHAIMITFLMTLLMNKSTNAFMDDWNFDEIHANYSSKLWYILNPHIFVMKYYHERLEILWKIYLASERNCNTIILSCPKFILRMTNNVRFTSRVGDSTWAVYN